MAGIEGVAYKNGRFMPMEDATVHILDPAFTKSDLVFDAVSVWDGSFFRFDDHMARFAASCAHVRMAPPMPDDEVRRIMAQCVDRAGLSEALVWVMCTRGRYADGAAIGDPRQCENALIAYAVPFFYVIPKERIDSGAHLWITETRRAPDAAINQRAKNYNRMDLTAATFEALDAGADGPVLLSTEGYLTEGPGYNVWVLKNGKAYTPGENMLEGITRLTVFDLCQEIGLSAEAADLTAEDLKNADEVFMSSTAGGIIAVTRVNDQPIGNGAPGLTSGQLQDLYWSKRSEGWHATPVASLLEPELPQAAGAE